MKVIIEIPDNCELVKDGEKYIVKEKKQVLSVEQMQRLVKLGLELKETMLYWARCVDSNPRAATHYGKWVLIKGNSAPTVGFMHWEFSCRKR